MYYVDSTKLNKIKNWKLKKESYVVFMPAFRKILLQNKIQITIVNFYGFRN